MRTLGRTSLRVVEDEAEGRARERSAVERVLAGDRSAFRVLVERHERGVYAVVQRLVKHPADAEDLAQQAFVAAFDALPSFQIERRFAPWLYRIAVNLAKDYLKSKKRGEVGLDAADPAEPAMFSSVPPDPERVALASERQQLLERALASLSLADREILVLKDVEDLSFDELREVLGRPVTALKIRAVRARQRLRLALERLSEKERA